MKQETVAEKIVNELLQQRLINEEDADILASYIMQAYAIGYDEGRIIRNQGKQVIQYSIYGDPIEVHDNIKIAARKVGVDPAGLRAVLKGRQRTAGGYKWKYVDK